MKIFLSTLLFTVARFPGYAQKKQILAARDPVEYPVLAASNFSQEYLAPISSF